MHWVFDCPSSPGFLSFPCRTKPKPIIRATSTPENSKPWRPRRTGSDEQGKPHLQGGTEIETETGKETGRGARRQLLKQLFLRSWILQAWWKEQVCILTEGWKKRWSRSMQSVSNPSLALSSFPMIYHALLPLIPPSTPFHLSNPPPLIVLSHHCQLPSSYLITSWPPLTPSLCSVVLHFDVTSPVQHILYSHTFLSPLWFWALTLQPFQSQLFTPKSLWPGALYLHIMMDRRLWSCGIVGCLWARDVVYIKGLAEIYFSFARVIFTPFAS